MWSLVWKFTFSIQETPYSCYITIRKRFASHSHHDGTPNLSPVSAAKCKETLVKENSSLKATLEEYVLENKSFREVIESFEKDKELNVLEAAAYETKLLKKC